MPSKDTRRRGVLEVLRLGLRMSCSLGGAPPGCMIRSLGMCLAGETVFHRVHCLTAADLVSMSLRWRSGASCTDCGFGVELRGPAMSVSCLACLCQPVHASSVCGKHPVRAACSPLVCAWLEESHSAKHTARRWLTRLSPSSLHRYRQHLRQTSFRLLPFQLTQSYSSLRPPVQYPLATCRRPIPTRNRQRPQPRRRHK